MSQLKDKTAIVTGGAGGIGSATCRRLAADGAKVAVFDMNLAAAEKVAAEIRAAGGQAAAFGCDITDRTAVDAAVAGAEGQSGPIVNVASDAARGGSSGEAVYSACKGGLVALSKTLAREHARHNINVNVVCPGPTDTALLAGVVEGARDPAKLIEAFKSAIPMGRLGQPDDLARAIAFFASDDAAFVTGQVLSVSGGLTMHG